MKFVQPVLPDQEVEIQICFSENEMRVEAFSCEQQAFSFVSNFSLKLQIGN
jgi:hypothetical protein